MATDIFICYDFFQWHGLQDTRRCKETRTWYKCEEEKTQAIWDLNLNLLRCQNANVIISWQLHFAFWHSNPPSAMHRHSNFESFWKLDLKLTWLFKNGFAFCVMFLIFFVNRAICAVWRSWCSPAATKRERLEGVRGLLPRDALSRDVTNPSKLKHVSECLN